MLNSLLTFKRYENTRSEKYMKVHFYYFLNFNKITQKQKLIFQYDFGHFKVHR